MADNVDANVDGLGHYWARLREAYRAAQCVLGDLAFEFGFAYGSGMREDRVAIGHADRVPDGFFQYMFVQALLSARDMEDLVEVKENAKELARLALQIEERYARGPQELAEQGMLVFAAESPSNLKMGEFVAGLAGAISNISFIGVEIGRRSAELGVTAKPDADG